MCKILKQYSDKIKGTFSFFDRMIINGYIQPLMNEHSRSGALYQLGVLYKNFKEYFMAVTDSIKNQIENTAVKQGRPVIYLASSKDRKEDIGKIIFPEIKDHKKLSSKVSRTLKKLRQHGLIKKVPKSRRYHVTSKGHRVMGTLIELRHKDYPILATKTA